MFDHFTDVPAGHSGSSDVAGHRRPPNRLMLVGLLAGGIGLSAVAGVGVADRTQQRDGDGETAVDDGGELGVVGPIPAASSRGGPPRHLPPAAPTVGDIHVPTAATGYAIPSLSLAEGSTSPGRSGSAPVSASPAASVSASMSPTPTPSPSVEGSSLTGSPSPSPHPAPGTGSAPGEGSAVPSNSGSADAEPSPTVSP